MRRLFYEKNIGIIDNIRSGKITYEQGVAIITVTIGYDDATARALLGNPEDYETAEEPIENTPDNTEETAEENSEEETPSEDNTENEEKQTSKRGRRRKS